MKFIKIAVLITLIAYAYSFADITSPDGLVVGLELQHTASNLQECLSFQISGKGTVKAIMKENHASLFLASTTSKDVWKIDFSVNGFPFTPTRGKMQVVKVKAVSDGIEICKLSEYKEVDFTKILNDACQIFWNEPGPGGKSWTVYDLYFNNCLTWIDAIVQKSLGSTCKSYENYFVKTYVAGTMKDQVFRGGVTWDKLEKIYNTKLAFDAYLQENKKQENQGKKQENQGENQENQEGHEQNKQREQDQNNNKKDKKDKNNKNNKKLKKYI
jgi:hypothetical protein